ncbi:prepilin peptidase [Anoxynatronum buryatiense]|uniref:Prepilin leader peptidase/N-methyltransferase n=1 Tax=Anoxynatronum buryatiense TaxID=489973 RepID=A0AA46AID1_9CLOT|nr:A24 family peptidase [Anoxynatronum buryatiense]SMP48785.1 type 4 prepilin peptidase 1 Aspartic peptidase. MEROPS family A24A [Anoxynatronum buryatiense]
MLVLFFLLLFIGSFLNVCIYRIPREESIVFPGSHCPHCNTPLKPFELLPVVSWLALRGKCRTCGVKISARYPAVELLTGILITLVYLSYGLSISFFAISFLTLLLIVMTFIDLDHQIIPDGLTIMVAVGGVFHLAYGLIGNTGITIGQAALGVLIGGGFFLAIAIVSNGGMGGGDIKLMAALGLWFGWQGILLVMFLSFIIGGIVSVGLLIARRKGRKSMVPFGPFIGIGTFLTAVYGNQIIQWYFSMFI